MHQQTYSHTYIHRKKRIMSIVNFQGKFFNSVCHLFLTRVSTIDDVCQRFSVTVDFT
jgi:hypothetical protein